MKKLLFSIFVLLHAAILLAQNSADSLKNLPKITNADDPSNFLTRIETFNELQRYNEKDFYFNQSIVRVVVKIGKRFTSRVDLPYVYNSFNFEANYPHNGLGDISFRLLGYKILETPKAALTASVEISLNTAESPGQGIGKNMLIPMITYSLAIPKEKMLLSAAFQQVNSVSGDEERKDVSFSKIQVYLIKNGRQKPGQFCNPSGISIM
jgi:hypothetical protein